MIRWTIVALALPCVAAAQTVRGTLTEQESRRPIAGAVVFLLDANQAVVARDLTSEAGQYRLVAPRAGTYRVRTLRIGFRPVLSAAIDLSIGQDASVPLAVESVPVSLSAVRVESRANCNVRGDATPAYNAWNEVATALNAALLSSRLRGTSATIVGYDRWTAPGSDVVLRQGATVRQGLPGQPWRSVSADSLHRAGFVVMEADGWYSFHALDLDVLLSDVFLQDHCLSLRGVDRGEIAIEFTPSRDRGRMPEIRGYVWLSATTLELRRVQFRYVNIPRQYEEADAGGELEFLKLENGSWVISRWQIRMPTAFRTARSDSYGNLSGRPEARATEVKTTGGDLLRLVVDGTTLWEAPSRTAQGRIVDSGSGRAIANARVVVAGTSYAGTTDAAGRFRIDDVVPGSYTARVFTPELESLATFHEAQVLFVEQVPVADISVPGADQLIRQWCPALARGDRTTSGSVGLLVGVVTSHDATPVANAEIAVSWNDFLRSANGGVTQIARSRTDTTDSRGAYRLCGPPTNHPLRLRTPFDVPGDTSTIRIDPAAGVRRIDMRLDPANRRVGGGVTRSGHPGEARSTMSVTSGHAPIRKGIPQ